jgi:hypothetical protein
MAILMQRIEKMEQEIRQSREREVERHKIHELELIVATLLQRMNTLEQECDFYRSWATPQVSNSGSNNHNSRNTHADQLGEKQEDKLHNLWTRGQCSNLGRNAR